MLKWPLGMVKACIIHHSAFIIPRLGFAPDQNAAHARLAVLQSVATQFVPAPDDLRRRQCDVDIHFRVSLRLCASAVKFS